MGGFKIYCKNKAQKPNLRFDLKNPLIPVQKAKFVSRLQAVLNICLHLLAQEFKHENHKRDKAQTQNAKVELVPLPCKKAH